MSLYPVFLDLRDARVVIVGGGPVAASKLDGLLAAGARVTVIAPAICEAIRSRGVELVERDFVATDLDPIGADANHAAELVGLSSSMTVADAAVAVDRDHDGSTICDDPRTDRDGAATTEAARDCGVDVPASSDRESTIRDDGHDDMRNRGRTTDSPFGAVVTPAHRDDPFTRSRTTDSPVGSTGARPRWVVAAATPAVNRAVAEAAAERGLFVNAVDDKAAASAYLGGVIRRGEVTVAISTGGIAPALAGLLREALDAVLPDDLERWLDVARDARSAWKRTAVPMTERRPLLLRALDRIYGGAS